MHVLVVGGAGYIGSVTVARLLEAGHRVTVLDDLSRGHRGAVSPGAALVTADYGDGAAVAGVLAAAAGEWHPVTAAVHFGARSQVGESVTDPGLYWGDNVGKGVSLVRALVAGGVRALVFSSTAAVFGEPDRLPITEESPRRPTNPYGRTKAAFEDFLADMDHAHGLKSICLRYFNAAGAGVEVGEDHTPETHLIPLALRAAAGRGAALKVFGTDYPTRDGTCVRDYIHVEDLADAHLLALDRLAAGGASDRFNLGNGQGFTVLEVLAEVGRAVGTEVPFTPEARRAGDPASLVAGAAKATETLGWRPKKPELAAIVADAWRWMREHPEGYGDSVGA